MQNWRKPQKTVQLRYFLFKDWEAAVLRNESVLPVVPRLVSESVC